MKEVAVKGHGCDRRPIFVPLMLAALVIGIGAYCVWDPNLRRGVVVAHFKRAEGWKNDTGLELESATKATRFTNHSLGMVDAPPNDRRTIVTFVCGANKYWDFLENILHTQSLWATASTTSVYVCSSHHLSMCRQRQTAYPQLTCRQSSVTNKTATNVFKTASILEAIARETSFHLLFIDVDIGFKHDVWKELEPYLAFDLAFSNQSGDNKNADINIGAVLAQRSRRAFQFWQRAYDVIVSTGKWDQSTVSDLAWDDAADVTFTMLPRRIIYAFGYGYPVRRTKVYEAVTGLHAVCMVDKWLILKELGFWGDVSGYYTATKTIRMAPSAAGTLLDAPQMSAYFALALKAAVACGRKVVVPDDMIVYSGQPTTTRFYELWNLHALSDWQAPILEPSYELHAAQALAGKHKGDFTTSRGQVSFFRTDSDFVNKLPCDDRSLTWVIEPDIRQLDLAIKQAKANTAGKNAQLLFYCPSIADRARISCQSTNTNHTHCAHADARLAFML